MLQRPIIFYENELCTQQICCIVSHGVHVQRGLEYFVCCLSVCLLMLFWHLHGAQFNSLSVLQYGTDIGSDMKIFRRSSYAADQRLPPGVTGPRIRDGRHYHTSGHHVSGQLSIHRHYHPQQAGSHPSHQCTYVHAHGGGGALHILHKYCSNVLVHQP